MTKGLSVQKKHNLLESNFEDCSMLYDLESGGYYVLNNVGTIIWGMLDEQIGIDVEQIIVKIKCLYPTIDTIEYDVMKFLRYAQDKGIVLLGMVNKESIAQK